MSDQTVERSPMTDVETSVAWVCAARLEQAVGHEDFVTLVNTLVEAVREDERAKAVPVVAQVAAITTLPRSRYLRPEHRAEIEQRYAEADRTPDGKVRRGWKQKLADELNITESQITGVITELRARA